MNIDQYSVGRECAATKFAEPKMGIWRVEVYENKDDVDPSSRGIVKANSEEEAVEIVTGKMGTAIRADITRTIVPDETLIPGGFQPF